jgi:adenosylcobinamide kinase/adenosylcobinamide-phosphate guanylyltransferase
VTENGGANAAPFVLVGGGARSGKSRYALARATAFAQGGAATFIATAEASDVEMTARIARHKEERGAHLRMSTLEAPLELPSALDAARGPAPILVDCLTLWMSNLLVRGASLDEALARVEDLRRAVGRRAGPVVLVTNEVGMGLVPETPLGRAFRDLSGIAHQRLARDADEIHHCVLGMVLRLRPGPVVAETPP